MDMSLDGNEISNDIREVQGQLVEHKTQIEALVTTMKDETTMILKENKTLQEKMIADQKSTVVD